MRSRHIVLFFVIVLMSFAAAGLYVSAKPGTAETVFKPKKNETFVPLNLTLPMVENILECVRDSYVDKPEDEKLFSGALNGMLGALDPHSSYLSPKEFKSLTSETRGEFGGLGMQVTMENNLVKVISPIDDTPAERAGIQPGDLIVAIDKKPIMGMTLIEAVEMLHGKPGTKVRLHLKREGQDVFEKLLKRAMIQVNPVKWHAEGNVGYIRVSTFSEKEVSLLKKAITDLKKKLGAKLEGIVLDFRNNPGGIFEAAIGTTSLFLPKGQEIVSTKGRSPLMNARTDTTESDMTQGIPLVVLINGGTASCPEIVAGALQDHHRAVIVGTKSFGKGSVQVVLPLANGGALKLTVARYYTPSGRSIQAKGIEPDIVVEQAIPLGKLDEKDRIHEKDFLGALDSEKKDKEKTDKKKTKEQEEADQLDPDKRKLEEIKDYQLISAINIVHAIAITKKNTSKR